MAFVLVESWLTKPKKDCKSVQLAGVGNFEMALIIVWSIWYPVANSWNPVKVTEDSPNLHLSRFRVIFFSAHLYKKSWTLAGMCPQWSAVVGTSHHSDKIATTQLKMATTISHQPI